MITKSRTSLLGAALVILAGAAGCSGSVGATGAAGKAGESGEKGDKGDTGDGGVTDPSVSAVSPTGAFLERTTMVSISGFGTSWTDAAKVDFGEGITVDGSITASPTAIVATISVAATAKLGTRDVTVTEDDKTVTYSAAFTVAAPLANGTVVGTQAQGSILFGRAELVDTSKPFDTSDSFGYLGVLASGNSYGLVQDASGVALDYILFLDVGATAGKTDVVVESGETGSLGSSRAPEALDVTARTPVKLTAGTPVTTKMGSAYASYLFEYTVPEKTLGTFSTTTADADADAAFFLLPASGNFEDRLAFTSSKAVPPGAYYVVYFDQTGTTDYDFDVKIDEVPSDELPNDTCMTAQDVAALPASLKNLTLSDADDEDWFKLTVDASAVGGSFMVATTPGDTYTDTLLEVVKDDCTSSLGESSDADYHETLASDPIPAAGTYYLRVRNSQQYAYDGSVYNLSIAVCASGESEPNDTYQTADAVCKGSTSAAIGAAGDGDWFAVELEAGDEVTAKTQAGLTDTCGPGGNIDTDLTIFDTDGTTVLKSAPTYTYCSEATTTVASAGTYFVWVGASAYCPNCTFDYSINVSVK